jgi:hypothetical protein
MRMLGKVTAMRERCAGQPAFSPVCHGRIQPSQRGFGSSAIAGANGLDAAAHYKTFMQQRPARG